MPDQEQPQRITPNGADEPIIRDYADMRKHAGVGIPKRVAIGLFKDHIEVVDKDNQYILNVPLSSIEKVKSGSDLIHFVVAGKVYSFEFALLGEKARGSLFGGLGAAGVVFSKKGKVNAWKDALESLGVNVKRGWL